MSKASNRLAITKLLKQLADDWLIIPEMPTYTGPRSELGKVRTAERERTRKRRETYQRIQYLKRKRWIDIKKTSKGLMVTLSDRGKIETLRRSAQTHPHLPSHQQLLVLFDFPQQAKNERDAFRYFIKMIGFTQMQMSVWKYDRDCTKDLKRFIKDARIEQWVKLFLGKEQKC